LYTWYPGSLQVVPKSFLHQSTIKKKPLKKNFFNECKEKKDTLLLVFLDNTNNRNNKRTDFKDVKKHQGR